MRRDVGMIVPHPGHPHMADGPVDIAVVVPVYRNRGTIRLLYDRIRSVLDNLGTSWTLILVDDACPERSTEPLRAVAGTDPRILLVQLDRNVGQARAVLEGLRRAQARYVVVMDADLQDPPEAIPRLLEALTSAPGRWKAVFAGHRGRYERWTRWITGRIFRAMRGWMFGIPRDAGSFGIICGDSIPALLRINAPLPHWPLLVGCLRLPNRSVPVARQKRPHGESAYSLSERFRVAAATFRTWWETRRRLTNCSEPDAENDSRCTHA